MEDTPKLRVAEDEPTQAAPPQAPSDDGDSPDAVPMTAPEGDLGLAPAKDGRPRQRLVVIVVEGDGVRIVRNDLASNIETVAVMNMLVQHIGGGRRLIG